MSKRKAQQKIDQESQSLEQIIEHQSRTGAQAEKRRKLMRDVLKYIPFPEVLEIRKVNAEMNSYVERYCHQLSFRADCKKLPEMNQVLAKFDQVRDLSVTNIYDNTVLEGNLQSIRRIQFHYIEGSKMYFEDMLLRMPNLQSLGVSYSKQILNPDFSVYQELRLEEILLHEIDQLTDLSIIAANPQIQSLSLKVERREDNCKMFNQLKDKPKLQKLRFLVLGPHRNMDLFASMKEMIVDQNELKVFEINVVTMDELARETIFKMLSCLRSVKKLAIHGIKASEVQWLQIHWRLDYLLLDIDSRFREGEYLPQFARPAIYDFSNMPYDSLIGTDQFLEKIVNKHINHTDTQIYINFHSQLTNERLRKCHPLQYFY